MAGTLLDQVRTSVERRYGRATWTALVGDARTLAADGSHGRDSLAVARARRDAPSDALACWIGRQAVAHAARQAPELLAGSPGLRAFLLELGGWTAGPAARGEDEAGIGVDVHPSVEDDLFVTVQGEGACCALVEGLIAGAAEHYGEHVRLELLKCCKWGDNRCVIRVGFGVATSDVDYGFAPLSAHDPAGRRRRVV